MKVKVHKITKPYEKIATKSLQAILRNHAYDKLFVHIGAKQLYDIMDELVRRRQDSDSPRRTNEETWREFVSAARREADRLPYICINNTNRPLCVKKRK